MRTFFDDPFFDDGETATAKAEAPKAGRAIRMESSDRTRNGVSRGLTPERLDEIMTKANSGDIRDLSQLAIDIGEKNWHIEDGMEVRVAAVNKVPWDVEAAEDGGDMKIAEAFKAELMACGGFGLDTFRNLVNDMAYAALPGISCHEIIWGAGGSLRGFSAIPAYAVMNASGEWDKPQLDTMTGPVDMPRDKFILHRRRSASGDPLRGGLVRTLAWLHCFMALPLKDLLRFVERYGMPFLVAKVDQTTWQNERQALKGIIKNFGPDGGGLFTIGTELNLLQAVDAKGDVYFKLLDYAERGITKVILGQLASSAEGGGLGNNGAQSEVRKDIRDSDCLVIGDCLNDKLARPWTLFNYGPSAPVPRIVFKTEPEEDKDKLVDRVEKLSRAGLQADAGEIGERIGIKLSRSAIAPGIGSSVALAAETAHAEPALAAKAVDRFISGKASIWAGDLVKEIGAAIADDSGSKLKGLGKAEDMRKFKTASLAGAIEEASRDAASHGVDSKLKSLGAK